MRRAYYIIVTCDCCSFTHRDAKRAMSQARYSETFTHKLVTNWFQFLISGIGYLFIGFGNSQFQINLSGPYFRSLSNRSRGPITPSTPHSPAPDGADKFTSGEELDNAGRNDGDEETFLLMQQSHATPDEGDDNRFVNLQSDNRPK